MRRHQLLQLHRFLQRSFPTRPARPQQEGRNSLRIVGVAPLASADGRLPLLYRTYPGNRPDAPLLQSLAADLARRCREIADGAEQVTLVFD